MFLRKTMFLMRRMAPLFAMLMIGLAGCGDDEADDVDGGIDAEVLFCSEPREISQAQMSDCTGGCFAIIHTSSSSASYVWCSPTCASDDDCDQKTGQPGVFKCDSFWESCFPACEAGGSCPAPFSECGDELLCE